MAPAATHTQTQEESERRTARAEVLTLRLVPKRRAKKGVRWAEEVVDNEHLGKKSSKKCCIYHKPKKFGDWDTDENSDSESDDCNECQAEETRSPRSKTS